ncbi:putative thiol peroxidase [Geobacter sp. OR-1]|uniref:thiol peroxidase n=1 Tax=Geobacter sp. OR-1 TaxID=1266765 RepID=UPI000542DDFC|nr:thiol peroxidase [Geobacter sp. OR-1]GAM08644.1 putative thiol peroxidase [Geobacter sp. OR-1]
MKIARFSTLIFGFLFLLATGCGLTSGTRIPVDKTSSLPGTTVTLRGETLQLSGTPLTIGAPLPATALIDANTMKKTDLAQMKGSVLFLNIVPSLDTKVCDAQTHYLGEAGAKLGKGIVRITISRDTPFAQKRFAQEAKLTDITYLSDYRDGSFGRATGLLQADSMLLARGVILVDKAGIVRYIQVVPELTHLPDMEAAFAKAEELL